MKPLLKKGVEGWRRDQSYITYTTISSPRWWLLWITLSIGKLMISTDIGWLDKKPLFTINTNRLSHIEKKQRDCNHERSEENGHCINNCGLKKELDTDSPLSKKPWITMYIIINI